MKLKQLDYFLGIVEHGGYAKAAARLFVAQSALSTQIKHLEEELGAPLFLRRKDGVQLTAAGDLLLRHAQVLRAQVASCKREIRDLVSNEVRGVVRLGIAVSASRMLTIPLLHRIQLEWPSVSLHVMEALTGDLERGLDDGSLDLAIGFNWRDPPPAEKAAAAADVLRAETFYLVSAATDSAAGNSPMDIGELDRIDLIMPTQRYATRRFIEDQLARKGRKLRIGLELDSLEQTMEMVVAGEGHSLMLVSTFLAQWCAGKVCARPLSGLTRQPQFFVRESARTATRASAAVRQLVLAITEELSASGKWPRSGNALAALAQSNRA